MDSRSLRLRGSSSTMRMLAGTAAAAGGGPAGLSPAVEPAGNTADSGSLADTGDLGLQCLRNGAEDMCGRALTRLGIAAQSGAQITLATRALRGKQDKGIIRKRFVLRSCR